AAGGAGRRGWWFALAAVGEWERGAGVVGLGGGTRGGADRAAAGQAEPADVVVHGVGACPGGGTPGVPGDLGGGFGGARVAEASGADRDPGGGGVAGDDALVEDAAAGVEQVEGDRAAAVAGIGGPVDRRHRRS